jgi:DNA-binding PadR family transcriptional regulator
MYSKELIRGTLKPIILKLLSEQGKMYGYEICQKVKEITGNEIIIKEGSLYPALYKLKEEDC